MNIGSQIKERRTVLHMTQDELADKLNVSRSAISNWETEKNYPDLQLIVMLSEVLDVSLDDLLKGDANVVEKISKDTKESKKLRTRTKVLIVVIGVLLVLMAGYFTVFAGLKYDISDSSHIKNMELIGNNIEVKLEIPSNWTNKEVWEDITIDGADTFVDFTICYGYGKAQKGDDTVIIPINTDDESDLLCKNRMSDYKAIRIVAADGKILKVFPLN